MRNRSIGGTDLCLPSERGFAFFSMRSDHARALLPAMRARRGRRRIGPITRIWDELGARLARRGGAAPERPADHREGRHRHAEPRVRADAAWAAVPGGRQRAYRAADRRQRHESRASPMSACCRRPRAISTRPQPAAILLEELFGDLPAPRLESAALLMVDDADAASLRDGSAFDMRRQRAELDYVATFACRGAFACAWRTIPGCRWKASGVRR